MANAGRAAGAVFIRTGKTKLFQLSGFFVTDRFFLTCAHFEITATVEEALRKSGSKIATLCTERDPYGTPLLSMHWTSGKLTNVRLNR